MKAIIFGVNGQDGFYLSRLLTEKKIEVIGISRSKSNNFIIGDVSNKIFVKNIIDKHKPNYIFHFAANSNIDLENIIENYNTICLGTLNILSSVNELSLSTKIFITGSGLQFKNENRPIRETDSFENSNAYTLARNNSVSVARFYRDLGLKVYVGYLYHHDSTLRKNNHLTKLIINHLKAFIANKTDEKLLIKNPYYIKEWGYSEDIVQGIFFLVNQDKIYESNIGTGIGYSILEWIKICSEKCGVNYEEAFKFGELKSIESLVSNSQQINQLGWSHTTSIEKISDIMINL